MKRICVYCGSGSGVAAQYRESARQLGAALAGNRIELVYGGADVGLMGEVADAALEAGGRVVGVITRRLAQIVKHTTLTELIVVESMHERKMRMFDLSDAFIALPGGLGTLEEIFEVLTWAQLGIHTKPVGLVNVLGYFDTLLGFLDSAVEKKFIRPEHRTALLVDDDPVRLLKLFDAYRGTSIDKWGN